MTQNSHSSLDEATREALTLIEKETETKIEQLLQHVKGACDSIRKNGANQLAKLPPEIRQLTAEEVCLTDKENFEDLLKQLKPKKLSEFDTERIEATEKQVEEEEEEKEGDDSYIDSELPLGRVPTGQRENTPSMGPLFIRLERQDKSNISIKLDPNQTVSELGGYTLVAPDNIMWQLENKTHRHHVWEQVEDIRSQLALFQTQLLKKNNTQQT